TIDIALVGATGAIDGDSAGQFGPNAGISLSGSANFSMGGAEGVARHAFKVTGFSLFGSGSPASAPPPPKFQPPADLKSPFSGAVIARSTFNGQGYIDVQFNDLNNVGIDGDSIIDDGTEFDLFINGQASSTLGVTVNGRATRVAV